MLAWIAFMLGVRSSDIAKLEGSFDHQPDRLARLCTADDVTRVVMRAQVALTTLPEYRVRRCDVDDIDELSRQLAAQRLRWRGELRRDMQEWIIITRTV